MVTEKSSSLAPVRVLGEPTMFYHDSQHDECGVGIEVPATW